MLIEIDFNSDEAIYQQLRDQIVLGIATSVLSDGDVLPSVRQLADEIGINMHTVNKTYTLLRQEGFIKVDRRRGCVVAVDADELRAKADVEESLRVTLAEAVCRGVKKSEVQEMVDRIYAEYGDNAAARKTEETAGSVSGRAGQAARPGIRKERGPAGRVGNGSALPARSKTGGATLTQKTASRGKSQL